MELRRLFGALMNIVFIGDSWQGSTARSLREALARLPDVLVTDVSEDSYRPIYRGLPLRAINRILRPLQERELLGAIRRAVAGGKFDAFVVYKGNAVGPALIGEMKKIGLLTVNIFPDFSPHAYGGRLKESLGCYDLVISTKPFHPPIWKSIYGYDNVCVCVPHGYDPAVHLRESPAPMTRYDVVTCANARPEYARLFSTLANLAEPGEFNVTIAGPGWERYRRLFPDAWKFVGLMTGRNYGEFLRGARVVIAPVNREVVIDGNRQPGDEDTIRTYELAAMGCFFVHQRTEYVGKIYDELSEVPLWSTPRELLDVIRRWLPDERGRRIFAERAHRRAVPAYSFDGRAQDVLRIIRRAVVTRA